MIRACVITESGMRCDADGEFCIAVSNKDTWVCWEHFQDMEAPNLKVIRKKIAKEIEAKYCLASDDADDEPFIPEYKGDLGCFGANEEHCDTIKKCVAIARGK
jgi:hypothetical protein